MALIHQSRPAGESRHWFSDAVIRKPQARRNERESRETTRSSSRITASHWASPLLRGSNCRLLRKRQVFHVPVSLCFCFPVLRSSSLHHKLSSHHTAPSEETDRRSHWKTPFRKLLLFKFIFYPGCQFTLFLLFRQSSCCWLALWMFCLAELPPLSLACRPVVEVGFIRSITPSA